MEFVRPEFLYLSPLVAVPVLIHLLNRIRYRVVRWAAIDFLLGSERRAVRRARLRQILLMALRTLLLAAAVFALARPVFSGDMGALLGGSRQVAIAVDASASMSAGDASGSAFARAKSLASATLGSLGASSRVLGGTFGAYYDCPFREAVQDHGAVGSVVADAELTAGADDIPEALCGAAERLARGGGGGTIWLLSDLQAVGWQAEKTGAWQRVREALDEADRPRIVISDLSGKIESNVSIAEVEVRPAVLREGDRPKIVARLVLHGAQTAVSSVGLFVGGRQIDSRTVQFASAGKVDVVFHLPELEQQGQVGYLQLSPDGLPADDRYYFLIRPTRDVPVLIVDGGPSSVPFEGAADFLSLALEPPRGGAGGSLFSVRKIESEALANATLADYKAVFLAEVELLSEEAAGQLKDYVRQGGLVMIFPGAGTDLPWWNKSVFPGVAIESLVELTEGEKMKVGWTWPNNPVVGKLAGQGWERLSIGRYFRLADEGRGEVLARTKKGDPFLICRQVGKGKAYVFAVSCQSDFSNLPFTPVLLLTVHRAVLGHLLENGEPLAYRAFDELQLPLASSGEKIVRPDGRVFPLSGLEGNPGRAIFRDTALAGIYRLASSGGAEDAGEAVAAVNVPARESELEKIDPQRIRELLDGYSVTVVGANGNTGQMSLADGGRVARSSFPLAALALALLAGEVLLAWSIGRSASKPKDPRQMNDRSKGPS